MLGLPVVITLGSVCFCFCLVSVVIQVLIKTKMEVFLTQHLVNQGGLLWKTAFQLSACGCQGAF